jgi:mannose-6-phosphate isomerase-like protein (cupin superfamily)
MEKINLDEKFATFSEQWQPRIVGELNGQHVKIARHHEQEDEMFLVLEGTLILEFRDRVVSLSEGELCIVPRGVEHRPVARAEVKVLLFEPASTLNTGNVQNDRTYTATPV